MATKTELLKMVRMFCAECMGGPRATEGVWPVENRSDIATCTAPECIWFGYRFGSDPHPNPKKVQAGYRMSGNLRRTGVEAS